MNTLDSPSTLPEVCITPESRIRHPLKLIRDTWRELLCARYLAWRLLLRDIHAQYRQSFLGIFWAFISPILSSIAFVLLNRTKILNIGTTDIPYPLYVFFSMTLWQTFSEALMGPIHAVFGAKPMLAKMNFPREAIIIAKFGEVVFNFVIKLLLIVALFSLSCFDWMDSLFCTDGCFPAYYSGNAFGTLCIALLCPFQ